MTRRTHPLTLAGLMFAATTALAQAPGTGTAPGTPGTPGAAGGTGTAPGPATTGPFNDANTPGWSKMTPEQRTAHQQRMQSFRTYKECQSYMDQMRARAGGGSGKAAAAGGTTSGASGSADACSHLPRS